MLLYAMLIVSMLIWFLDVMLGIDGGYYMTIPWWDVPLHVLGGFWLALFAMWVGRMLGRRVTIIQCLSFVLFVGILWEIFEVMVHIGGSVFMPYYDDTIKDMLDDLLGGILGFIAAKYILVIWRK